MDATCLWQRFLRITPAFWVCLAFTAFLFAAVAWVFGNQGQAHCDFACFVSHPRGPFQHVLHNSLLKINQSLIIGMPRHIPFAYTWNSPLWTLSYESPCHLVLAALAELGLLRHRAVVLVIVIVTWALELGVLIGANKELISMDDTIFFVGPFSSSSHSS